MPGALYYYLAVWVAGLMAYSDIQQDLRAA